MGTRRPKRSAVDRAGRPLSRVTRYTARLHLPAAVLEGLVAGLFTLNDIVLRKAFGAGAVLITVLVMAPPASQLLSIVWGRLMEGREKRRFILAFGGGGRIVLFALAFATTPVGFLTPLVLSITLATAVIPALNAVYQTNYTALERGRVFGWVMSATALATIGASMGAGAWLDADPRAYRVLYPLAAIIGFASAYLYHRIRARRSALIERAARRARRIGLTPRAEFRARVGDWLGDVQRALRNPLAGVSATFRENPDFLRFEVAYMVYGMAFMILQPVLPIYLVDEVGIQYTEAATARGLIFWGMIAVFSPLFGRLLDRWNAVRVSLLTFALLIPFPLLLTFWPTLPGVYGAFALYGFAMAGVNIAWTMGPILFAGAHDAARYMGVHVTMVGIRGVLGNGLGLVLLKTLGSRGAFLAAAACFVAATILVARLDRRMAHGPAGALAPNR